MSEIKLTKWEYVNLKICGYFTRGSDTFIYCDVHKEIVKAYVHGWTEKLECPRCFRIWLDSQKKKEFKTPTF